MARRVPEEKESISTDLRSDISFMNRQKELRTLYRDFRSAMDTIQQLSTEPAVHYVEEEDGEEDFAEPRSPGREPDDVELIIGEIDVLETETDEILALLAKPKLARNPRVKSIIKRLTHLQRINAALRRRAESLLDVE
jgi:hypothetical protein